MSRYNCHEHYFKLVQTSHFSTLYVLIVRFSPFQNGKREKKEEGIRNGEEKLEERRIKRANEERESEKDWDREKEKDIMKEKVRERERMLKFF